MDMKLHADYHGRGGDSIIETGEDLSSRCTCDLDDRLGIDLFGSAGNASRSLRFYHEALE